MLSEGKIRQIRDFNRQYVIMLGLLKKPKYGVNLSWPERRIMIEIGLNHLQQPMAIAKKLHLDKSYTSRLVNQLVKKDLLVKRPSKTDSRAVKLAFTSLGQKIFTEIDQLSNQRIQAMLTDLNDEQQEEVFRCIKTVSTLLFKK